MENICFKVVCLENKISFLLHDVSLYSLAKLQRSQSETFFILLLIIFYHSCSKKNTHLCYFPPQVRVSVISFICPNDVLEKNNYDISHRQTFQVSSYGGGGMQQKDLVLYRMSRNMADSKSSACRKTQTSISNPIGIQDYHFTNI